MKRKSVMIFLLAVLSAGVETQAATPDWKGTATVAAGTTLCVTYDLDQSGPPEQQDSASKNALDALTEAFRTPKISDYGVTDFEVLSRTNGADDHLLATRVRVCRPFVGTVDVNQLPTRVVQMNRNARTGTIGYCVNVEPKDCRESIVSNARPSSAPNEAEPYIWSASFPFEGVKYLSALAEEERAAELVRLLASNQHRKEKIGASVLVTELDSGDASLILERGTDGALVVSGRHGFELATKANAMPRPFLLADGSGASATGGPQASLMTIVFVAWPVPPASAAPKAPLP